MSEKYHIKTEPVLPRLPRIGKYGPVDWREDCARCHNCVKKACIYDKYREESEYIRNLESVENLFYECMGCLSCMQDCTKSLLNIGINPEFKKLGNEYWTPDIIQTTWYQAETASVPVSGSGYKGKFSGPGFDSMWTDMSEIVRPTRDGIHGREYISTSVDIGRKPPFLTFDSDDAASQLSPLISLPLPVMFDMVPEKYSFPKLESIIINAARKTGLIAIMDSKKWPDLKDNHEKDLEHIVFYVNPDGPQLPDKTLRKTRAIEIPFTKDIKNQIIKYKDIKPEIVVIIRVDLDKEGVKQAIKLSKLDIEAVHVVADAGGNEIGSKQPRFIKDMLREIHCTIREAGNRDEITVIAGGGIALAEHLAKAIICGADLVSIDLPLMLDLECRLCYNGCNAHSVCPARLDTIDLEYGVGRMTNLMGAWHWQLVEVMGAMGMREARRLRGDVGRAMFYEELEKEIFGEIFNPEK
jgi:ferredoxin